MGRETPEAADGTSEEAAEPREEETSSLERAGEVEEAVEDRLD